MRHRVVVVGGPTAADWRERRMELDLDSLQRRVGGLIERVPVCDMSVATVYCNEEGKLRHLPPTAVWMVDGYAFDVLLGPLVIAGPVDETGNHTDLTDSGLEEVRKYVLPVFVKDGREWTVRSGRVTLEEPR